MSLNAINGDQLSLMWNNLPNLNPFHKLNENIRQIAAKKLENKFSKDEIAHLKHAYNLSSYRIFSFFGLKNELAKVSLSQFEKLLEVTESDDAMDLIQGYLDCLQDSSLMSVIDLTSEDQIATHIAARAHLAKYHLTKSLFGDEGKVIFEEFREEAINFIYRFCDILIAMTGIGILGQDVPENFDIHSAQKRIELYFALFVRPKIMFDFFSLYMDSKAALAVTTVALVVIPVAILVFRRYFKRCPSKCYGLENLSKTDEKKDLPAYKREDVFLQFESAFASGKSALLVGDPDVGKSTLVRSFIEAVKNGECCQDFIKKPQIFGTNAVNFVSSKNQVSIKNIENTFKDHFKEVIFFFDEFSAIFNEKSKEVANKMKTFLDKYTYVVGAMTTNEYIAGVLGDESIESTFDGRRFTIVHLTPLKDEELKDVLSAYLREKNPEIDRDKATMSYIVEKAKEFNVKTSKIDAATMILRQAIKKITTLNFTKEDEIYKNLKNEETALKRRLEDGEVSDELNQQYDQLMIKFDALDKAKKEKTKQFEALKKVAAIYYTFKKKGYQIASKIYPDRVERNPNIDTNLKRQWLKNAAIIKVLGKFIGQKREELELPSFSKKLIDEILQEQSKNKESALLLKNSGQKAQ